MRVQYGACWDEYQARLAANAVLRENRAVINPGNEPEGVHRPGFRAEEAMDWDGGAGQAMDVDDEDMGHGRINGQRAGQGGGVGHGRGEGRGEGGEEAEAEADNAGDPWLKSLKKRYAGKYLVVKEDAAAILPGRRPTFLERFSNDEFAEERKDVPYYPFRDREEWELAEFLSNSTLSMSAIDDFLELELVRILQTSSVTFSKYPPDSKARALVQKSKGPAKPDRDSPKRSNMEEAHNSDRNTNENSRDHPLSGSCRGAPDDDGRSARSRPHWFSSISSLQDSDTSSARVHLLAFWRSCMGHAGKFR